MSYCRRPTLPARAVWDHENDDVGSRTALIRATEGNQFEIVKLRLRHAADPTMEAKFHSSTMEATSNPEIMRLLSEAIASCRTSAGSMNRPTDSELERGARQYFYRPKQLLS